MKAQKSAEGEDEYDEDAVLDHREKARRDKEKELASDLNNAADLFGAAALGGASHSCLCMHAWNRTIFDDQALPPRSSTR